MEERAVQRMSSLSGPGEAGPLRFGEGLPLPGAEAAEGGDRLVQGGAGLAALAGLALRGAEDEQAAAELERQPPLARLGDNRANRGCSGGRAVSGQVQRRFGAAR